MKKLRGTKYATIGRDYESPLAKDVNKLEKCLDEQQKRIESMMKQIKVMMGE